MIDYSQEARTKHLTGAPRKDSGLLRPWIRWNDTEGRTAEEVIQRAA